MRKSLVKCGLMTTALLMSMFSASNFTFAQPISGIHQMKSVLYTQTLEFQLQAGESMVTLSPPDLKNALDSTTYLHINVHPGERVVLSYERYNTNTGNWEPAYVKVFDHSYHGRFNEKDRSQTYRYVMTGDHLQGPINEYIVVNYTVNE